MFHRWAAVNPTYSWDSWVTDLLVALEKSKGSSKSANIIVWELWITILDLPAINAVVLVWTNMMDRTCTVAKIN